MAAPRAKKIRHFLMGWGFHKPSLQGKNRNQKRQTITDKWVGAHD